MNSGIILAAGIGRRTGLGYNKVLYKINNKSILEITVMKFLDVGLFSELIIVTSKEDFDQIQKIFSKYSVRIIIGGVTRSESVKNGIEAATYSNVWIHDGARPFITKEKLIECNEIISLNKEYYCFTLGSLVVDTLAIVEKNIIIKNLRRDQLRAIQTPQIVNREKYLELIGLDKEDYTDESGLFVAAGYKVKIITGEDTNNKITSSNDIRRLKNNEF